MNGPVWNKEEGRYEDVYRDTAYEGTNEMPDNGPWKYNEEEPNEIA